MIYSHDTGEDRPLVEMCDGCDCDPATCGDDPRGCAADAAHEAWEAAREARD